MAADIPPDAPVPRLCHLSKWPDFNGFGFNLHAEKNRTGQYIGKVDDDSPAEAAGLRQGDRIVEVNGVNIANENHKQVVGRIRSGVERDGVNHLDEVELLVLDDEADKWYKDRNIVVRSDFAHVRRFSTPLRTATVTTNGVSTEREDSPPPSPEPVQKHSHETREIHEVKRTPEKVTEKTPEKTREKPSEQKVQIREEKTSPQATRHPAQHVTSTPPASAYASAPVHAPAPVHTPEPAPAPTVQSVPSGGRAPDLKLPQSAAEYKAMLASKKKPDIRNQQTMNFSKKHEIFQSM